jgi:hypothetical protein
MQILRVTLLAAGLGAAGISAAPSAAAIPGYLACPSPPGLQYDVVGDVTCADTWVVDSYDPQGDKYQDIANFTCYSGTAEQRPVVLTCVSENGELVASSV